jgi:hypothetical protein
MNLRNRDSHLPTLDHAGIGELEALAARAVTLPGVSRSTKHRRPGRRTFYTATMPMTVSVFLGAQRIGDHEGISAIIVGDPPEDVTLIRDGTTAGHFAPSQWTRFEVSRVDVLTPPVIDPGGQRAIHLPD